MAVKRDNATFTTPEGDSMIDDTLDAAKVARTDTAAGERVADDVQAVREECASGQITAAATTTLVTGPGYLRSITVLGGVMGQIDVYDNTAGSGTKVIPSFTPPAGAFATLRFDVPFSIGLTIVTAAATVLQVSYR